MFDCILIANRGEIACRVIRTCRKLGIRSIAVYSTADADAQHVRMADAAYPVGGPRPQDSYLRGDAIIEIAKRSGAQAIHPGYGFLSENADFAAAVAAAGLVFIGPSAESMRKMGSKAGAKELMAAHGVPVVPGYTGEAQDIGRLQREADSIGYPLMIKAAHGGGGKGMRIVRASGEFAAALESCQREAKNAFGRERVLLERYIEQPRHIEFQIFGDAHGNVMHLGERECSAQRRYQKVIEESPSPLLTAELRVRMGAAAVAAAHAIDYTNAGTVEFIVGPDAHRTGCDFHFMEINTRLQVEHPVTEMVTGLDLVEWQLRIAAGEPLPLAQDAVRSRGHAIEVRLYAEDPAHDFLPGSGRLDSLRLPIPAHDVRIDSGVIDGDTVSIFYDPMIAKLIVWGEDRARAMTCMRDALAACEIRGPKSNIDFLERLIRHPVVVEGRIDTGYLDRHLDEFLVTVTPSHRQLAAVAVAALLHDAAVERSTALAGPDPHSPWALADGWRVGHDGLRTLVFVHAGERIQLLAGGTDGHYRVRIDATDLVVEGARLDADGALSVRIDDRMQRWRADVDSSRAILHDDGGRIAFERSPAFHFVADDRAGSGNRITAPMPGRIVLVKIQVGDSVTEGQELLVMEAMKMELSLKAARAGSIATITVAAGDFVDGDALLVTLEA